MDFIKSITKKPSWRTKICDSEIVEKWRKEYLSLVSDAKESELIFETVISYLKKMKSPSSKPAEKDEYRRYRTTPEKSEEVQKMMDLIYQKFTWPMFELSCQCACAICGNGPETPRQYREAPGNFDDWVYCLCQTRHPIELKKHQDRIVNITDVDPTLTSLKTEMLSVSKLLEAMPTTSWHPNTDKTVLDLIHPSMNARYSEQSGLFHWQPSLVERQPSNGAWKFTTPLLVENTDPEIEKSVSSAIESVFNLIIHKMLDCYQQFRNRSDENVSNDYSRLQVIVKMANTILTPENPEFKGGNWHLEGVSSEQIVATGIYYYHMSNVTDSGLRIRVPLPENASGDYACDLLYEQGEHHTIPLHYRLEANGDHSNGQDLGKIVTKEDTFMVFPNFVQHKVLPFQLEDKTQPGSRNILLFWLVDPTKPLSDPKPEFPSTKQSLVLRKVYRDLLTYQRSYSAEEDPDAYIDELNLCEH